MSDPGLLFYYAGSMKLQLTCSLIAREVKTSENSQLADLQTDAIFFTTVG